MVYHFSDLDVLRLALTSGAIPPATALAPARAHQDDSGLGVEPAKALPKKADAELRRLGARIDKQAAELDIEAGNWLQLLPLTPDPQATHLTSQTPVVFDLADPAQLPVLVGEMLRLGNDRQAFRVLTDRVLLRVIGPPYYSLLRALDRDGQAAAPVAYVERRPRVWLRLGCTHPLLETITPAAGQLLFLAPPREWSVIQEEPFRDIYEILDFQLPAATTPLEASELAAKLVVPLRLGASGGHEAAELWVITRHAIDQVDRLVRELDEAVIDRLAFAVGQRDGAEPVVVLKVRPSKQAPPVLVLDALACRHYLKLANLFVPVGRRVQPPLRRDAHRRLLAPDAGQVVWLMPEAENSFTPQQLPDDAFRPLKDWVDYILDHDHEALTTWMQATRFDFEPFICSEDSSAPKAKPPGQRRRGKGPAESEPEAAEASAPPTPSPALPAAPASLKPFAPAPPSQLQQELAVLEQLFLTLPGPLDSPERQTLWPRLAELNAALGRHADATLCWLNARWEGAEVGGPVAEEPTDADALLAKSSPTPEELRGLALSTLQGRRPHAGQLRQFLEKHEANLPVRLLWLAWLALAKDDALALARARDRILDRLLTGGLDREHDLPSFLRFERSGDRYRLVRDRLRRLHELAREWSQESSRKAVQKAGAEPTLAYLDLIFAFGFARLGEQTVSRDLQAEAEAALAHRDEVHELLYMAYAHRIQQVLAGQPPVGQLPAEFHTALGVLADPANKETYSDHQFYKVESLRNRSRILEPQQSVDPYRSTTGDEVDKELFRWSAIQDRDQLVDRVRKALSKVRTAQSRYKLVKGALRLAPRIGTELTVELLDQVLPILDGLPAIYSDGDLMAPKELLERAVFLAAHHDRSELVQALMAKTHFYLDESLRIGGKAVNLEDVTAQSLRGLRRLGLGDQVAQLLARMSHVILQGRTLQQMRAGMDDGAWTTTLVTLQHLAGGWLTSGKEAQAAELLATGRDMLLGEKLNRTSHDNVKMNVARAYVAALAQGETGAALAGIEELFLGMGGFREVTTHSSHYFILQLQFVESVVLAVVSDDFALSQIARRWLEEDEYLVRRRIHRDVRQVMG